MKIESKKLDMILGPKQVVVQDMERLEEIRSKTSRFGYASQTTLQYQNDIIDIASRVMSQNSGAIIEIGAYHGGLTCQLAYLAEKYDRELFVVDILCNTAREHLQKQGFLGYNIHIIEGTVENLFSDYSFESMPPAFVVVDADHTYHGVRHDLCHLLSFVPNTPAIAFHDFGLRVDNIRRIKEEKLFPCSTMVDRAILDCIGDTLALHPIGEIDIYNRPVHQNYYWEKGLPEGVILLTKDLKNTAFSTAYSYISLCNSKGARTMHALDANELFSIRSKLIEKFGSIDKLKNTRIAVYGTGNWGYKCTMALQNVEGGVEISFYVDSDHQKKDKDFCGKKIKHHSQLNQLKQAFDKMIIASSAVGEIKRTLLDYQISEEAMIYLLD